MCTTTLVGRQARLSLKVDSHFLDDFDFGDLGATGGKSGEVGALAQRHGILESHTFISKYQR